MTCVLASFRCTGLLYNHYCRLGRENNVHFLETRDTFSSVQATVMKMYYVLCIIYTYEPSVYLIPNFNTI